MNGSQGPRKSARPGDKRSGLTTPPLLYPICTKLEAHNSLDLIASLWVEWVHDRLVTCLRISKGDCASAVEVFRADDAPSVPLIWGESGHLLFCVSGVFYQYDTSDDNLRILQSDVDAVSFFREGNGLFALTANGSLFSLVSNSFIDKPLALRVISHQPVFAPSCDSADEIFWLHCGELKSYALHGDSARLINAWYEGAVLAVARLTDGTIKVESYFVTRGSLEFSWSKTLRPFGALLFAEIVQVGNRWLTVLLSTRHGNHIWLVTPDAAFQITSSCVVSFSVDAKTGEALTVSLVGSNTLTPRQSEIQRLAPSTDGPVLISTTRLDCGIDLLVQNQSGVTAVTSWRGPWRLSKLLDSGCRSIIDLPIAPQLRHHLPVLIVLPRPCQLWHPERQPKLFHQGIFATAKGLDMIADTIFLDDPVAEAEEFKVRVKAHFENVLSMAALQGRPIILLGGSSACLAMEWCMHNPYVLGAIAISPLFFPVPGRLLDEIGPLAGCDEPTWAYRSPLPRLMMVGVSMDPVVPREQRETLKSKLFNRVVFEEYYVSGKGHTLPNPEQWMEVAELASQFIATCTQ